MAVSIIYLTLFTATEQHPLHIGGWEVVSVPLQPPCLTLQILC